MPSVNAILETALYVSDLSRAATFYRRVFDFKTMLEADRLIALDVAGKSVLLLFKAGATTQPASTPGGTIPGHGDARQSAGATHFAFSIATDDVDAWRTHLESLGIAVESTVKWPADVIPRSRGGAVSLYFRDPDSNLVELITPGFWPTY